MSAIGEDCLQSDEVEEEQEQVGGDGYPAKRQRLVHPRDVPTNSVPTTSTTLERAASLTALSSTQKILAYYSTVQTSHAEYNAIQLERVAEAAKGRAIETGHHELADAIHEIYERSRFDKTLRALLNAVLTRSATPAQEDLFQNYYRIDRSSTRAPAGHRAETHQDQHTTNENQNIATQSASSGFVNNESLVPEAVMSTQLPITASTTTNLTVMETDRPAPIGPVCFGMPSQSLTALMTEPAEDYQRLNLVVKRGRLIVGNQSCRELANLNSKVTNVLLEILQADSLKCEMFVGRDQLTS
ncbi:unnamed protein product [Cercospora beticola]|nr:unnamed protein product [Cercospora beticola]